MAASSTLVNLKIKIDYKVGVTSTGKDVFKKQQFSEINGSATDDKFILFADALQTVLAYNTSTIGKNLDYVITRG